MQPLRVVHITEAFEGGVETFLQHVLPAQVAAGLHVTLIYSARQPDRSATSVQLLTRAGVQMHQVPMQRGMTLASDIGAWHAIRRISNKERFDLVHTHGFKAGVLGRLAAMGRGVMRTVHTPHCFPFVRSSWLPVRLGTLAIERFLARQTNCLHLVSDSESRQAAVAGYRLAQCVVISNAVPPCSASDNQVRQRARQTLGLSESQVVLGTCCRLVAYKCVDHLLQALNLLQPTISLSFVCLVLGDGPDRQRLQVAARNLGLTDVVRFLGHRPDIVDLLPAVDVLVQCAKAEGMPYAILEAMSLGIPVVASSAAGHVDLIRHGQTGLHYRWGNVSALRKVLDLCLDSPDLRRRLGQAGNRHVVLHHRLENQVASLVALYTHLCATAPRASAPARPTTTLSTASSLEVG